MAAAFELYLEYPPQPLKIPFLDFPRMKLYEFEGKTLLAKHGITIPDGIVVKTGDDHTPEHHSVVIKAQVLCGGRGKAGGILIAHSKEEAKEHIQTLQNTTIKGETPSCILVEKQLDIENEYYLSITYDTRHRAPVVIASRHGGVNIEDQDVKINPIDLSEEFTKEKAKEILSKANFEDAEEVSTILLNLFNCFKENDCRIAEINPLIKTKDGQLIAADAKVVLDTDALSRQSHDFPARSASGRELSEFEIAAKKIDADDHRGTAGGSFYDLDGDIAILASGGGASLTCVDALIGYGGKPANYVEYSGNPSREKVKALTKVTLSKPNLKGCWVVGGTANFTDIYETLGGFMDALDEINPSYPIVIRRAGPRDIEAFEMIEQRAKEKGYDITLFSNDMPMTLTAQTILEKVQ